MARQIVTETTDEVVEPRRPVAARSSYYRTGNIVYIIFGLLELLLLFRFVFLLLGANPNSGFVSFIYGLSEVFVMPFYGIFGQVNTSAATLDPATLIAMVVYAILGWVILRIVAAANNRPADPV